MELTPWILSTVCYRIVVTTIPMASIIGAQASDRGYILGGFTSGGFAVGELFGALFLSRKIPHDHVAKWSRSASIVSAAVIILAGALVTFSAAFSVLAPVLVFLAGAFTAPLAGILRASAGQSSAGERVMALDNILNQLCWVVGPIVGVIGIHVLGTFSLFCMLAACLILLASLISSSLAPDFAYSSGSKTFPRLSRMIVPITSSFVIMAVAATFDTAIPIRLFESVRSDASTSWVLSALAASSVIGSALCLWRPETSLMSRIAGISTLGMSVGVGALTTVNSLTGMLLVAIFLGIFQAPAMVFRQILVTRTISPQQLPGAFSLLYAAGGLGYSLCASIVPIGNSMVGLSWTIGTLATTLTLLSVVILARSGGGVNSLIASDK